MKNFKLNIVVCLILIVGNHTPLSSKAFDLDNSLPVPIDTRYQCFTATDCKEYDINLYAVAESCNSPVNLTWKYIIRNANTEKVIQYSYNYVPEPLSGTKAGNILDNLNETIEANLHIIDSLSLGTYRVSWTLIDNLGNISHKDQYFDIVDNEPPTADIVQSAHTFQLEGEIKAITFDKGFTFEDVISSFDNCSDELYFTYSPVLPNINDDPLKWAIQYTQYGKYLFDPITGNISTYQDYLNGEADAWYPSQNTSGRTLARWCKYNVDCDNFINQKIYVWDKFAMNDDCDGNNFNYGEVKLNIECDCYNYKLSGYVTGYRNDLPLANMIVEVDNDAYVQKTKTDTNGYYEFHIRSGEFLIEAYKNSDYINGITTLDIIHIQKYLLAIKDITDPYKLISAEVNRDETISAADILDLRKLILGVTDTLRNNSWLGIPKDYVYEDPKTAFQDIEQFPKNKIIINENNLEYNYSAIKIGDLNFSADVLKSRDYNTKSFVVYNQEVESDKIITIPFYSKDLQDVYGFQLKLNFDGLKFIDISSNSFNINSNKYYINGNNLTLSLTDPNGKDIDDDEVLFEIVFRSKVNDKLSNLINITQEIFNNELYTGIDLSISNLDLEFRDYPNDNKFGLEQNVPNPFTNYTNINFTLPEKSDYSLLLYDITGKLVHHFSGIGNAGKNTFQLNKENCNNNFFTKDNSVKVLIYKLQTISFVSHKKMIWINPNRL